MKELIKKYGQAVEYLPPRLRHTAMQISDEEKVTVNEFRLRAGRSFSICFGNCEQEVKSESVLRHEELQTVLELATKSSVHSAAASLREGFVTVPGGHRVGICGTAIRDAGGVRGFRDLSSVSVRIAKFIENAADGMVERLAKNSGFCSTLIISPPGHGKTTTLRDLVRRLSDSGFRVSLVDERGELAAKHRGVAQFDVGRCTDIMDGTDKASGAMMMLRTMSPDIIALDEITARDDVRAISEIANCGVGILATAHGRDADSLFARPLYRELYNLHVFENVITLSRDSEGFHHKITEMQYV